MSKDDFWHTRKDFARSFERVKNDILHAQQSEEARLRAEEEARAEAERRRAEEKKKPELRQCKKCGDMTRNPCQ